MGGHGENVERPAPSGGSSLGTVLALMAMWAAWEIGGRPAVGTPESVVSATGSMDTEERGKAAADSDVDPLI